MLHIRCISKCPRLIFSVKSTEPQVIIDENRKNESPIIKILPLSNQVPLKQYIESLKHHYPTKKKKHVAIPTFTWSVFHFYLVEVLLRSNEGIERLDLKHPRS